MSKRELSIAIPGSLTSDIPHLREKTLKIGMIGRAAAIFGVERIIIFPDTSQRHQGQEMNLISTILSYMETPQYLRRRLFKIRPELRYAGILPPLRTPHHPLSNRLEDLTEGQYREGMVVSRVKEGALVDVGVERPVLLRNKRLRINKRLAVRVTETGKLFEAEVAHRSEIAQYWGYKVDCTNLTLGKLLENEALDLAVATSKYGKPLMEVSNELVEHWKASRRILVAFGAPSRGLHEIARKEHLELEDLVDYVINTFPRQEVETVRTEEALFVALGSLNLLAAKG